MEQKAFDGGVSHRGFPGCVDCSTRAWREHPPGLKVQKFMATTTEMANNARGATVLYIPDDDLSDLEAASKDKDLVQPRRRVCF